MSTSTTLEILAELKQLAEQEADGDKLAHAQLVSGLQRLQNSVMDPSEKMTRLRFGMYHNVSARVAQEFGVLKALVEDGGPVTAAQLSETLGKDEVLIVRILRILTKTAIVDEVGPRTYRANETTRFATSKGITGDIKFNADIALRISSHIGPLAKEGLLGKIDPHTRAFGKPMFVYQNEHREYGQAFEDFMTGRRAATWAHWYDIFPALERVAAGPQPGIESDVLLVDIAGGQGYWTTKFREALLVDARNGGKVPGRLIVQDQPHVIVPAEGVETMAYDFFTEQPIKGARFYCFKQIIHDWDDEKSTLILKNTADAMGPSSTLLINDYVLPEVNVGLRAAYMDMAMLVLMEGIERTEAQWRKLIERAGLKIIKIWNAEETNEGTEGVIECQKA